MAAPAGDFFAVPLAAQEPVGPQTPRKPPEIVRIPTRPETPAEQPPIAPDEIIRRFSAQEDQLAHLFATYGYRKTVRLEEIGSDGKVSGQAEISSSSLPISDDARRKAGGEPQSTLRFLNLERDDIEAVSKLPAYSRSDGSFDDKGLSIPVRLIIRWDQYAPLPPDNLPRQSPQDATPQR